MGEFSARITAQDFVTPPEFANWRLAPEGVGRIGGARFTLEVRHDSTKLTDLYEQIPIRVFPVNCGPTQPELIYLANPTAGLMDGDAHLFQIHAQANIRAVITGQSATRIHPAVSGFCTQQWDISVADGAVLVVLPGPAIPYAGCRFFQRVNIQLGKDARFIWGDLWFAGRYARGDESEKFRFECIVQDMQIFRETRLVYRDRFAWHGSWNAETANWHFGGHPAAGSVFVTSGEVSSSLSCAVFGTAAGDTCCRFSGRAGDVIKQVTKAAFSLASQLVPGPNKSPWLLTGHPIAGTHWFSSQ